MIQFFNADVDVDKLCYTSMVTFGDDGVPSGDLRRISMADYKKMVSLIACMQRLTVCSPTTSRKHDDKEWKRDLKQFMQMTGIERQHTQSARRTLKQVKQQVNLLDAG